MAIKVSVVVPVYNPGPYIDGLLASLRRQSLPRDEWEAIFVDDGSTDGTGERLEALAAEVANYRVIRIPNSGWPGRPRNVGTDAARGEYVQFVDHDDELGDEALERLWNYADANRSDVLVGREERRNRRMPVTAMFRENRPRASLGHDPLLGLLTPHKMFRRAFLIERDIRFLEGPRRLEDHHFVVTAYFRADVISILAEYPCYYWIARDDGGNAGSRPYEWVSFYAYVRDILDVVEEHTEPGPFRDTLLAHWYRGKGLRLLSTSTASRDEMTARAHFEALHRLTEERFPPSVDEHLAPMNRIRSALLRSGEFDRYRALEAEVRGMTVNDRLEYLRAANGALEIRFVATLMYAGGAPVSLEHEDGHALWPAPVALGTSVPQSALDFTACASTVSVDLIMRRRSTRETVRLPGSTEPLAQDHAGSLPVGAIRTVKIDAETVDHGRPMRLGEWELDVQVSGCGWNARGLLCSAPSAGSEESSRVAVPFLSRRGEARLVAVRTTNGPWRLRARRHSAPEPSTAPSPLARAARLARRSLFRMPLVGCALRWGRRAGRRLRGRKRAGRGPMGAS